MRHSQSSWQTTCCDWLTQSMQLGLDPPCLSHSNHRSIRKTMTSGICKLSTSSTHFTRALQHLKPGPLPFLRPPMYCPVYVAPSDHSSVPLPDCKSFSQSPVYFEPCGNTHGKHRRGDGCRLDGRWMVVGESEFSRLHVDDRDDDDDDNDDDGFR